MEPGIDGVGSEYLTRRFETLLVAQEGPVVTVTMNRPEIHNAFNPVMIREITDVMRLIGNTHEARVVVLAGNGENFSAGADINYMAEAANFDFDRNVADALDLYGMYEAMRSCPKPIVARVQGLALGGGSGLAAAADVVVASEGAKFGFTEVTLGILPAIISDFVKDKVNPGAMRHLFLNGRRFSAQRAYEIGLVQRIATQEGLDEAVAEEVHFLLKASTDAEAGVKEMLPTILNGRQTALDFAQRSAKARASKAGKAGLTDFTKTGKAPNWETFDPDNPGN